jgi:DNA-binding transcriptional ArsR family regulator
MQRRTATHIFPAVSGHVMRIAVGSLSSSDAIAALAALAQPTRLKIFRMLLRHEPDGVAAGVIAKALDVPHNTMSSHLAILVRAGLLQSTREGRTIIYRANIGGMQGLISFLLDDCCDGHPELCGPGLAGRNIGRCLPAATTKKRRKKR